MPMSKAESEDVANQLCELKGQYDSLKGLMETVNTSLSTLSTELGSMKDSLTTKIDEGNFKLTTDMQRLECSLKSEVKGLKDADEQIRISLNDHIVKSTTDLDENRVATNELKDKVCDMNVKQERELNAANEIINAQAARILSLEKQCHRGLQHHRGWNVEIDGIPKEVGDEPEKLRKAVLELFSMFHMDVSDIDIETIHRLPSRSQPKPVIIRFISRESVRELHNKKRRLRDLGERFNECDIVGLTEESKIFIRASQCTYYRNLAFNCRVLKRQGLLSQVLIGDDGKITIKLLDNSFVKVSHETTLVKYFPNFDGFNFDYDEKERED